MSQNRTFRSVYIVSYWDDSLAVEYVERVYETYEDAEAYRESSDSPEMYTIRGYMLR